MYVSQLQNVGVKATHDHIEDEIHGSISFMSSPIYVQVGIRIKEKYSRWLEKIYE